MNVTINGKNQQVEQSMTVAQLIVELHLHEKKLAVEVNRKIIPSAEYERTHLCEDDVIEIIEAIGGG